MIEIQNRDFNFELLRTRFSNLMFKNKHSDIRIEFSNDVNETGFGCHKLILGLLIPDEQLENVQEIYADWADASIVKNLLDLA